MAVTGTGGVPSAPRPPVDVVELPPTYDRETEWSQLVRALKAAFLWDWYKDVARELYSCDLCARDVFWLVFCNDDQGIDSNPDVRDRSAYRWAILVEQWRRSGLAVDAGSPPNSQLLAVLTGVWSSEVPL